MLSFVPDVPENRIAALLEAAADLPNQIAGVRSFVSGRDLALTNGNADFAIVAEFDNDADWRAYLGASEHARFAREFVRPVRGRAVAIQITTERSSSSGGDKDEVA